MCKGANFYYFLTLNSFVTSQGYKINFSLIKTKTLPFQVEGLSHGENRGFVKSCSEAIGLFLGTSGSSRPFVVSARF